MDLELDLAQARVADHEWLQLQPLLADVHARLLNGNVPGGDALGWLHWPSQTLATGVADVQSAAADIRDQADALVVIGIGGSYLGARAAAEWCLPEYSNQLSAAERGGPELYFAGNHLSASSLQDLLRVLEGKRVCLNVVSKSGTTTEPAVHFRILRQWLTAAVGAEEARRRIYATTDARRGALRQFADAEGYRTFVIPDDIGGRYSVLTPVGLLPLAAAGIDIVSLLQGAARAEQSLLHTARLEENAAYRYAAVRNALARKGRSIEILAVYEPALRSFAEWWKQLFGESEGKDGKGIYPSSVGYTTDLHSLGQFVQQGTRNLFETVVALAGDAAAMTVPAADMDDGLAYLASRPLRDLNEAARQATALAHADGGVPNLLLTCASRSADALGQLFWFFELACAASGLLLGVNPFDQPGVEMYKSNMFALLGKPGYEAQTAALASRLTGVDSK